jgi:hypothetical protein
MTVAEPGVRADTTPRSLESFEIVRTARFEELQVTDPKFSVPFPLKVPEATRL